MPATCPSSSTTGSALTRSSASVVTRSLKPVSGRGGHHVPGHHRAHCSNVHDSSQGLRRDCRPRRPTGSGAKVPDDGPSDRSIGPVPTDAAVVRSIRMRNLSKGIDMNGMTVADVMTYGAVSATVDTPYRDLVDLIETRSVNAVPVIDRFSLVLGVVSASDLLHKIEFAGGGDPPRIFESRKHRQHRRRAA